MRFERINVVGASGSGKTTFARRLARTLGLPYYEMDALYRPGNQGQTTFFPAAQENVVCP